MLVLEGHVDIRQYTYFGSNPFVQSGFTESVSGDLIPNFADSGSTPRPNQTYIFLLKNLQLKRIFIKTLYTRSVRNIYGSGTLMFLNPKLNRCESLNF